MFIFTKRVGNNFCILDDQDGSCEWLNNVQVMNALRGGIQINGLALTQNGLVARPMRGCITGNMCNWFRNQNILKSTVHCDSLDYNSSVTFTFSGTRKSRGKSFGGVIDTLTPTSVGVYFASYNVAVLFDRAAFTLAVQNS